MNQKQILLQQVRLHLHEFGKINEPILNAMQETNRKDFMPKNTHKYAYENSAIPIGHGQTISQPSTVARMLSLLELKPTDEVLEIGTGSAWNATLLSKLSKSVITLEIVEELASQSQEKLEKQKINNVKVRNEDFRKQKKKFDKIIFTAGIIKPQLEIIETFAKSNLKNSGILLCPYQNGPLIIIKNKNQKFTTEYTEEHYVFVPLVL